MERGECQRPYPNCAVAGGGRLRWRRQGTLGRLLGVGFVGMLLVGASGTITALGDTLFPAASLREGLAQDFSSTAHFLVRLRIWHPVLAIATGVYVVAASSVISIQRPSPPIRRWFWTLAGLFGAQLIVGAVNVWLLAPVWMQLAHLLLADLVWICFVLLSATALSHAVPDQEAVGMSKPERPTIAELDGCSRHAGYGGGHLQPT